jgi:hypothetical protein
MIQQIQNSYPMKEWHLENMKKTIVKYVTGLSKNAGNLANVHRNIDFDIKHGVTIQEVLVFLDKIRNAPEFSNVREIEGSIERLDLIKIHFSSPMPY